jgi:hypothetical protein
MPRPLKFKDKLAALIILLEYKYLPKYSSKKSITPPKLPVNNKIQYIVSLAQGIYNKLWNEQNNLAQLSAGLPDD